MYQCLECHKRKFGTPGVSLKLDNKCYCLCLKCAQANPDHILIQGSFAIAIIETSIIPNPELIKTANKLFAWLKKEAK